MCSRQLVALSGYADRAEQCLFSVAQRTWPQHGVRSAYDPKRTLRDCYDGIRARPDASTYGSFWREVSARWAAGENLASFQVRQDGKVVKTWTLSEIRKFPLVPFENRQGKNRQAVLLSTLLVESRFDSGGYG